MPFKTDKLKLGDPFLKRSSKLLPCQREMVLYWHNNMGYSIHTIAKAFKVSRRLIQFIIYPERHKKNLADRQSNGGTKQYYNKEKHAKTMKDHRQYKQSILKNTIK